MHAVILITSLLNTKGQIIYFLMEDLKKKNQFLHLAGPPLIKHFIDGITLLKNWYMNTDLLRHLMLR